MTDMMWGQQKKSQLKSMMLELLYGIWSQTRDIFLNRAQPKDEEEFRIKWIKLSVTKQKEFLLRGWRNVWLPGGELDCWTPAANVIDSFQWKNNFEPHSFHKMSADWGLVKVNRAFVIRCQVKVINTKISIILARISYPSFLIFM